MSVVHAVYGYNGDKDFKVRFYEEGDLGYPCFTEVGTLTSNGDDVRAFGYYWELDGMVGDELFSFAIPSPKTDDFTLRDCDWRTLELDIEREVVRRLHYVDTVQLETEEEYDTWVAASRAWFDGDGEGYYYAPHSNRMKLVWYVREFEEMLDIVARYRDVDVLLDYDIERLEDDGWKAVSGKSGKIAALVKRASTE